MSKSDRTMASVQFAVHPCAPRAQRTHVHITESTRELRRDSFVMFEQTAKPLAATDGAQRQRFVISRCNTLVLARRWNQQFVADVVSLVWTFRVVMVQPRIGDAVEMLGSEENEMVEAFTSDRADESLDECLRIRRSRRAEDGLATQPLDGRVERLAKLAVAVALHVVDPQPVRAGLLHERLGLSGDPIGVGMERGGREHDAPRINVQERQDKGLANPLGRQNFLGEEVTLPEAGGMLRDELIPSGACPLGTRLALPAPLPSRLWPKRLPPRRLRSRSARTAGLPAKLFRPARPDTFTRIPPIDAAILDPSPSLATSVSQAPVPTPHQDQNPLPLS